MTSDLCHVCGTALRDRLMGERGLTGDDPVVRWCSRCREARSIVGDDEPSE